MHLSSSELSDIARYGLGFTPSELTAIQHQIDESVRVQSARVGEAAAKSGEAAATKSVWKAAIASGIGGGILGGLLGFVLARRR